MSRGHSDSILAKISAKHVKGTSPRTSVYDRLGPPGLHAQTGKTEETCRYILKNGHCRFGDECTYDHATSHALIIHDHSGDVTQFISSTVESNLLYREKSQFESSSNDGNMSALTIPERKLIEIDQIKGNIRKHISGSSNIVNNDDLLHKELCMKKSRIHKQMGSVVQRGCKTLKINCSEDHVLVNDKVKSISSSFHRNTSLDRETSMTSESFYSGDERDSSTDSISENESLALGVSKVKDSGEKALSSISESSFSSVPSTDKIPIQKKRSLRYAKRVSRDGSAKVIDSLSKKENIIHTVNCYNHELKHRPATSQTVVAKTTVPVHCSSHKYFKKHSKRIKTSLPEDSSKYRKDHHRDKKRLSKSSQANDDHLKSLDVQSRGKSDREKRFRTHKNLKTPSDCLPEDSSQISHNLSLKNTSSSSKKLSDNFKCCTPNESLRTESSILALPERITSSATFTVNPIPNSVNFSKHSNTAPKPNMSLQNIIRNVDAGENLTEVKNSINPLIDSSSELSIAHDKLSLNSNQKRKHSHKYSEIVEKKLRKSEGCNLPRRDFAQLKDRRSVKNEIRPVSNLNSKSDSPVNVFKDCLEIYDSLSDIDQVTLFEEDFSQNFVKFTNGSHLLDIDWACLNFNTPTHIQPQILTHNSLLSQVGISYSLLGEDTYAQCLNTILNNQWIADPQITSYLQDLGLGALIEEIIFLEKDRIHPELDSYRHYGYIKRSDIYLRRILSGYRGILNSSSDSLSGNIYNSPCITTDIFNSALSIYHRSGFINK